MPSGSATTLSSKLAIQKGNCIYFNDRQGQHKDQVNKYANFSTPNFEKGGVAEGIASNAWMRATSQKLRRRVRVDWTITKKGCTVPNMGDKSIMYVNENENIKGLRQLKKGKETKGFDFLVHLLTQKSFVYYPLSYHHSHHRPRHYVPSLCYQGLKYPSSDYLLALILRMSGLG